MNTRTLSFFLLTSTLACAPNAVGAGDDCGEWVQIVAPNPEDSVNTWLTDVDMLANDDAWAVGYFAVAITPYTKEHYTYIVHWDGDTWQHVPSPSPGLDYDGGTQCYLYGVEAIAPDDVWAVGHFKTQQSHGHVGPQPLTLHWNGSEWSIVPAPFSQGESSGAILSDVDAIASDDIWAGGIWPSPTGYGFPAFMLHWDGSEWTPSDTPTVAHGQRIRAVAAIASDDVWAVGGSGNAHATSYVIHYDGNEWSLVDAPSPSFWNFLNDIQAIAPDDIWIAGEQWDTDISYQPLMLHWDGTTWSEVPSPGGGQSIVALASDDVWSADVFTTGGSIAHYDGTSWQVRDTVLGPPNSTLLGMSATSGCDIIAVGRQPGGGDFLPLIEHLTDGQAGSADLDGDGSVGFNDLIILLAAWGDCAPPPAECVADIDSDGTVGFGDLITLLSAWGMS